jgi:hypothetical protein
VSQFLLFHGKRFNPGPPGSARTFFLSASSVSSVVKQSLPGSGEA